MHFYILLLARNNFLRNEAHVMANTSCSVFEALFHVHICILYS